MDKSDDHLSLDDVDEQGDIILISKENKSVTLSKRAAQQSGFISHALNNDSEAKEVTLKNIETETLEKVVDYLHHHVNSKSPRTIEKPLQSCDMRDLVCKFDADFCQIDQAMMFKLLLAANYMDIPDLLELMCAKTASLMKGKSPEQIQKVFNIRSDYTPEEERQVREEHRELLG